jgi:hypothetical protein
MLRVTATSCVFLALLIAGCGGGSDSSSTISYKPWSLPPGSIGELEARTADEFLKPSKNGLVGPELKPIIPDRPPPEFLISVDLIDGFSPATASPGDRLTVQYVGADYESKKEFASSWDEGKPFTFTLGTGEVIDGWEEGLESAEISDRRELVIPPELASGGSLMRDLPSGSTLVYILEILDIKESN